MCNAIICLFECYTKKTSKVLSAFNTQFESVGIGFGNRKGFNILDNVRALKKLLLFTELFILDPPLVYFFFRLDTMTLFRPYNSRTGVALRMLKNFPCVLCIRYEIFYSQNETLFSKNFEHAYLKKSSHPAQLFDLFTR